MDSKVYKIIIILIADGKCFTSKLDNVIQVSLRVLIKTNKLI